MLGEARIHPGEDDEEMRFEGLDGMLRGIATMDVRRYELVFTVPFLGDHMNPCYYHWETCTSMEI